MTTTDTPLDTRAAAADADRIAPAILAIAFGAFLVLGAGFALAFPCH